MIERVAYGKGTDKIRIEVKLALLLKHQLPQKEAVDVWLSRDGGI